MAPHLLSSQNSEGIVNWRNKIGQKLETKFRDYRIAKVPKDMAATYRDIEQKPLNRVQRLWVIDDVDFLLDLFNENLFGNNYQSIGKKDIDGSPSIEKPDVLTYSGTGNGANQIRITIADNIMLGAMWVGDEIWYFEPAHRLDSSFDDDEIILYKSHDIIQTSDFICGVQDKKREGAEAAIIQSRSVLSTSTGSTICRKIQVAQAYESGIVSRYGNPGTSTWNAAIWNTVNGFYSGQFTENVVFEIISEFYSALIPFPDRGNPSVKGCIEVYLTNFQSWGEGGGFGAGVSYDIGNLWTSENVTGCAPMTSGVIGSVMDIPGVCGTSRYQIFEDFVGPTANPPTGSDLALLAVLIAHESGHNIGMFHNNPAGDNIMEPVVNSNATSFSDRSLHYFQSTAMNVGCYSSCSCIEIIQATPGNCSSNGLTFDVEIVIEHDSTTGSFTIEMGPVSLSTPYGSNPQTVTLMSVPSDQTTITVTDNTDTTCTFSVDIDLPAASTIAGITNDPYCFDNLPNTQAIASDFSESFGSIVIEVNGDIFSNDEQSAQVVDPVGNVVADFPRGTFADTANIIVNSGALLLSDGPFDVLFADWFGDGMGSSTCQATNGGLGDYEIRDGQGNVIRATAGLQNVIGSDGDSCSGNNAAMEIITGIFPAIDSTRSGTFSGAGITDTISGDGMAAFDASTLTTGEQLINYIFETAKGCFASQRAVDIYDVPVLSFVSSDCEAGNSTYTSSVSIDLGAWNSVLSGDSTSISISSGGLGTLSSSSISSNGNITVINIPIADTLTIVVGDGAENGGCQGMLEINPATCALPVELIRFEGFAEQGFNRLEWVTGSEINNRGFEILSGIDASEMKPIGWVDGHVNSSISQQYKFKDFQYHTPLTYYQLQQLDFNGHAELSSIISITVVGVSSILRFDNVDEELIVSFAEHLDQLRIFNIIGQEVYQKHVQSSPLVISTHDWLSGIYLAVGFEAGEPLRVVKIMIP